MRKVIFLVNMSLDGFTAGPKGELDWLIPQAVTEESYRHFREIRQTVDTVLLGRLNYEGFVQYWPTVAKNPASAQKDVEFSRWLDDVEKVIFSHTLKHVDWTNAKLAKAGAEGVATWGSAFRRSARIERVGRPRGVTLTPPRFLTRVEP